jgi:hypothetical protein
VPRVQVLLQDDHTDEDWRLAAVRLAGDSVLKGQGVCP